MSTAMETKADAFKNELRDLLKKYNADIYIQLDGDTHGVNADLVIDVDNKEVIRTGSDLSHHDIK